MSSEADLEELMIRLARAPLDDNYRRMARAARDVGRTFFPETIAPGLRSIIEAASDETNKQ